MNNHGSRVHQQLTARIAKAHLSWREVGSNRLLSEGLRDLQPKVSHCSHEPSWYDCLAQLITQVLKDDLPA
jgi:hypothetical protein